MDGTASGVSVRRARWKGKRRHLDAGHVGHYNDDKRARDRMTPRQFYAHRLQYRTGTRFFYASSRIAS